MHKSGTLVFKPNETRKEIQIVIIDDSEYEPNSKFRVVLSNP